MRDEKHCRLPIAALKGKGQEQEPSVKIRVALRATLRFNDSPSQKVSQILSQKGLTEGRSC